MKEIYTVKIRQRGHRFWKKYKNVTGDHLFDLPKYITLIDDTVIYFPADTEEIIFSPERAVVIEKRMSKEAGQPVQRA